MRVSNGIIFAISAAVAAFLLFLWFFLGFNQIDSPFDLVLAIVWWLGIALIIVAIVLFEKRRKRQIRTIYVSPTALYNSEKGIVGLGDSSCISCMKNVLQNLSYGFGKKDLPDSSTFDFRYIVQTESYKQANSQTEESVWKGSVITLNREGENAETLFENEEELQSILKL